VGDEKRYYWLKLKDDFFKSRKMKKLRKVAGGDTYTIIYLKLQLLSINNDGVIEFEGTDEDIFHQLSLDIDEEIDDIKMTVAFCTANDLIEVQEQDLFLNDVPKLIGSETQAARRMRRKRAKDSKAIEGGTNGNNVQTLRNNVTEGRNNVRSCYTEIERDIDIERRDRDKSKRDDDSWKTQILSAWNSLDKNIPKIKSLNAGTDRHKLTKARINEYGIEAVLSAIRSIDDSQFLKGYKTDFVINYDWFIRPNNFVKVRDGNYIDRSNPNSYRSDSRYSEADTDISDLEAKLDRISKL
jgi:phage replisome organizer N-terminal domain protein